MYYLCIILFIKKSQSPQPRWRKDSREIKLPGTTVEATNCANLSYIHTYLPQVPDIPFREKLRGYLWPLDTMGCCCQMPRYLIDNSEDLHGRRTPQFVVAEDHSI